MWRRWAIVVGVFSVAMGWTASVAGDEPDEPGSQTVDVGEHGPATGFGLGIFDPPTIGEDLARELEEQPDDDHRRLTLMLTGNIAGNFARVDCREEADQQLYWARQAGYFNTLNDHADNTEFAAPIALNVGNSPFPGALGRYLTTRNGADADRLADIIEEIPLMAHGVGHREFALPRQRLVEFAQAMDRRDIPMQAANLECQDFGGAEALCDSFVSYEDEQAYRTITRDGVDIAVTTVLDEQRLDGLSRFQREGIRIVDPKEMLPPLVEKMSHDADLVVVQHQVPSSTASPRSYELASEVEGIDLLVASNLIDSPSEAGQFDPEQPASGGRMAMIEAAATGTPIVSANSGEYGAITVELDTIARPDTESGWMIRRAIPRRVQLDGAPELLSTSQVLESTIDNFCSDWGDPIGQHSRLSDAFQMEELQKFILNVMRFSTRTELALSNRGAFRNQRQFPLTGQLTRADVYTALPFENRLVTVTVDGSTLNGLKNRIGDTVVGAGIEVRNDEVRINGRSVSPDRSYRIAINDFLAEGGDGVFSADDITHAAYHHPPWSDEPPSIGDVVVRYVEDGQHLRRGQQRETVSAEDNFPDLNAKFLWSLVGSLNTSYNQVTVENPGDGYDQNQLTVQSTDQLNLEGRLAAHADSRYHGWDNSLDVQYAATRIDGDDQDGFEETRDRIRLRSRYRYKRLRATREGRWYIPDPFVEGQAESEFTRPDERDWHRLNMRGIGGASFQLFEPLDVQLGLNVSQDVLQPDGEPTWGVNAAYTLARVTPLRLMDRPIRVQSEVEYFYNDIGRQNIHEARSSNRIFFAIFGEFFFTTTFNAFLYRDDTVGELGTNTELTVGVNYEWERAFQNF